MSETVRNWAGNVEIQAGRVHRPTSVPEVQRIVAAAEAVRAFGTGHSFNRIAATDGDLVLTGGLPPEVEIDASARTARVSGGMRLAEIAARLHAAGFALANLPSLPHISLAGAVATATHGSGNGNRNLAALVTGLRMVTAEGDVVDLARDPAGSTDPAGSADFAGSVVSLGALGVVTHLTVELEPTFDVAQYVYLGVSIDQLLEHADEVFSAAYSVSGFTDWYSDAMVWLKVRASGDGSFEAPALGRLGGRLAHEAAHPILGMPTGNSTEQLGVPGPWHERLPHFRPEFTPSSGKELQSEFFVDRSRAAEALRAVQSLGERIAPVVQVSEIRTVAADDLWLSPCYRRDNMAIHFTWIEDRRAVAPVLAAVERELLPLGARPHWGKLFLSGPEAALAGYERAADFRRLIDRYDPRGKFRNHFVQELFPEEHV